MRYGSCSENSHLLVQKHKRHRREAKSTPVFQAGSPQRRHGAAKCELAPGLAPLPCALLVLQALQLRVFIGGAGTALAHGVQEEALYLPRQYDVFTAHVPKIGHGWLARRPDPVDDAPPKPSRLQVLLDAAMRHRPLRGEQPGDRGLHYREACLQQNRWVLAIGTSVMRILFMRLVEEYVVINQAHPCLPGWRFQSHGACNSLKRGAPCVIDVRSNSSAGSMRFTFVWSFGWAQREGDVGYRMYNHDAIQDKNRKQFLDSEAAAGRVLVGRFGAQSAAILKQLIYEAPRVPDLLLAGPDAWNLRDPPGLRLSNVASFLDFLLGSQLTASGTTCVWLGARQSSAHYRRIGPWQQTLAEFEQEEARLRSVVAARGLPRPRAPSAVCGSGAGRGHSHREQVVRCPGLCRQTAGIPQELSSVRQGFLSLRGRVRWRARVWKSTEPHAARSVAERVWRHQVQPCTSRK